MTAPSMVNPSSVLGKAFTVDLTTTAATAALSNAALSGHLYKVDSLVVSNIDTAAQTVSVNYYSAADLAGTATPVAYLISVPAGASLIVVDKLSPIYLEEDRSLGVTATVASKLKVTGSYEDVS